jgi:hypothetical protein
LLCGKLSIEGSGFCALHSETTRIFDTAATPNLLDARKLLASLPEEVLERIVKGRDEYRKWNAEESSANEAKGGGRGVGIFANPHLPGVPRDPWECQSYRDQSGGWMNSFHSWMGIQRREEAVPPLPPRPSATPVRVGRSSETALGVVPDSASTFITPYNDRRASAGTSTSKSTPSSTRRGVIDSSGTNADRFVGAVSARSGRQIYVRAVQTFDQVRRQGMNSAEYNRWARERKPENKFSAGFFRDLAELLLPGDSDEKEKEIIVALGLQRGTGLAQEARNNRALAVILERVVATMRTVSVLGTSKEDVLRRLLASAPLAREFRGNLLTSKLHLESLVKEIRRRFEANDRVGTIELLAVLQSLSPMKQPEFSPLIEVEIPQAYLTAAWALVRASKLNGTPMKLPRVTRQPSKTVNVRAIELHNVWFRAQTSVNVAKMNGSRNLTDGRIIGYDLPKSVYYSGYEA